MFATISCSCCNGASWPDPVMLKLVYIPYVLFSYIIHTHTWVLCPWCVCVCVASVTCVRGQERGTMRSSAGRAQGLRENKMTEGHMEEERAHTREDTWAQKNHIQTLPAEAGDALPLHHPLLSDLRVSTDRRGSSENQLFTKTTSEDESCCWYGPIKRKKYRSYHRVLLWLSTHPALVSLVLTFAFCVWDYIIFTSAGVSHSLNFSLTPIITRVVKPFIQVTFSQ